MNIGDTYEVILSEDNDSRTRPYIGKQVTVIEIGSIPRCLTNNGDKIRFYLTELKPIKLKNYNTYVNNGNANQSAPMRPKNRFIGEENIEDEDDSDLEEEIEEVDEVLSEDFDD